MRHTAIRIFGSAILCLGLVSSIHATPFRLLAIGDSLTEEYRFETLFSAPDSDFLVANTKNWVELLHAHRPTLFTMGGYEPSLGNYFDFRNAGYEYNYGVPGFKAERWDEVLYREYSIIDLLDPENSLALSTKEELRGDLASVDAVLIFVGGNDLSLTNDEIKNNEIKVFIGRIHDYVRNNAPPNLPIIISTVPDIGATPDEQISDPTTAAAARQRVAILNSNIANFSSRQDTYIARIDAITDFIFDTEPIHLNGTEFSYPPDPENPPLTFFCKLGFHPASAGQALIANEILKAINQFATTPIPLFTNREILSDIIGQNPEQPYLDYAGGAGSMLDNPDGDALPNLIEFLLATNPTQSNAGFTFLPGGGAKFTPSSTAQRFADLTVLQSETLANDWIPVPESNIQTLTDGSTKIIPSSQKLFYKFQATPKP
ncbi:MAG: SGNH/GDSL hydrolase family protein [Verrucomicrobia bacterium]|nr:SGNH/GDSL hydrolase family protein [Verrucomicrobiota bacterium]